MDPFAEQESYRVQVVQGQEWKNVCYNLFSEKKESSPIDFKIFLIVEI